MASYSRFLFDTNFDPEQEKAARAAELAAEREALEVEPPPPSFSEAELDAARAEGLAAGREAGRQEALRSCEQRSSELLASLAQHIETLVGERTAVHEEAHKGAMAMALAIVRKLFPRLVESQTMAEIEAIVSGCFERLRCEPRIVIRVTDDVLDMLRERIAALSEHEGFEGKVVLLSDESLSADSVRVEWADGGAERESTKTWAEIDQLIGRSFGEDIPARAMQLAAQREFEKDDAAVGRETTNTAASPDSVSSAGREPKTGELARSA